MTIPELILLSIGMLLIWAGIKDKNPLAEIKQVLAGGDK